MSLRTRPIAWIPLALLAVALLPACGGGGYGGWGIGVGIGFPLKGTAVAENDTTTLPATLMHDFRLWPTGYAPPPTNLLPFSLFPGESAAVADVDEDWYDADSLMSDGFVDYLETWSAVHVEPGTETAFVAF